MTIGVSPPRLEAGDKATGRARYVDDIRLPGMLHAALVTSPHAHAKILGYRLDAARAIPGVKAIVTGDDLKGPRSGGIIKDESMVARRNGSLRRRDRGRGRGGRSRDGAARRRGDRGHLRAVAAVLSIDAALAADAPLLHEEQASYVKTVRAADTAMSCSKARSKKATSSAPSANATSSSKASGTRRRSTTSTWNRTDVWPMSIRPGASRSTRPASRCITFSSAIAEELGEPMAKIRVVATRVGGGFGGKHASNIHSIAAWLARAARRPVKLMLVAHAGFRDPALAPSGAHLDENRRAPRRHDLRARREDHARWRRLRGRKPGGAGVRAADGRAGRTASQMRGRAARWSTPTNCAPGRSAASAIHKRASRANRRSTSSPPSSAWIRSSCA